MTNSSQPARNTRLRTNRLPLLTAVLLAILLGVAAGLVLSPAPEPTVLEYGVSLTQAVEGQVEVSITLTGNLPDPQHFYLPVSGNPPQEGDPGIPEIMVREAVHLDREGRPGPQLSVTRNETGWQLHHRGQERTRLVYLVNLQAVSTLEEDIRLHLTVPHADGFRAAGYHLFLVPEGPEPHEVTIRFHGLDGGTLAVPWPREERPEAVHLTSAGDLGDATWAAAVCAEAVYRPANLRDLFASLIAWGDMRLQQRTLPQCNLRVGMSSEWLYADNDLISLFSQIAAAEIDFFGSPPQPAILCLVVPNPVQAQEGFDYYGVHVGHSILLFLDPEMTYADLTERAANVLAHEMFHGWLGESIRQEDPALLWFVEGATTWYSARILRETGIWSSFRAESVVGERIHQNYYQNPLLGEISIAEAGAGIMNDALTTRFAYAGGTLAAATLDRWLAQGGGAVHPLDDVLRYIYRQGSPSALTRRELEAAVEHVTGVDSAEWLNTYVYGKETLPVLETLF